MLFMIAAIFIMMRRDWKIRTGKDVREHDTKVKEEFRDEFLDDVKDEVYEEISDDSYDDIKEKVYEDIKEEVYDRSEEHTSELQSRGQLVRRLLHEKKKKTDATS